MAPTEAARDHRRTLLADNVRHMDTVETVINSLAALGLEPNRAGTNVVTVRLPSEKRGTIGVHMTFDERSVGLQAFVMRGPDRAKEAVYRRLLRRHFDRCRWRFALDDDGDIFLVARSEIEGFDEQLDGLLGELSLLVDETYEGMLRTGFDVPDGVAVSRPS